MKYRSWVFITSALMIIACIVLLATKGLNYGTDFKGGLKLVYNFAHETNEGEITSLLSKAKLPNFVVQRYGDLKGNDFVIKAELPEGQDLERSSADFTKALVAHFETGGVSLIKEEFVGPKVGKELRRKGIYAMIWAWIIMLIYMGFRFDFYFAPGGIIALIHDVIITMGAFALTGREVNLTVVAAFLTIVGYSINDTIIIFDRIRENIKKHKTLKLTELIDLSVNSTLTRTLITSLTVFFVVVVLFFRAQGDIQNFAFAMIVGVVTGTYSSVFIASPIFLFLKNHGHRFGLKSAS